MSVLEGGSRVPLASPTPRPSSWVSLEGSKTVGAGGDGVVVFCALDPKFHQQGLAPLGEPWPGVGHPWSGWPWTSQLMQVRSQHNGGVSILDNLKDELHPGLIRWDGDLVVESVWTLREAFRGREERAHC